MHQYFLLMMKPGFLSLIGTVCTAYVKGGFIFRHGKLTTLEDGTTRLFYYEHREKKHFLEVCNYMTSGNVYPMVFKGSIEEARKLLGPTDPAECHEGEIRAISLFHTDIMRNIAHCSSDSKSAIREIALIFPEYFHELFPEITEEIFANEYPEIPSEYYPRFAGETGFGIGGTHVPPMFFLLKNIV